VVERLLVEYQCSWVVDPWVEWTLTPNLSTSSVCGALAIRYLAGILDLPGFWLGMGSVYSDVAKRLCFEMVRILKDIGVDVLALGPIDIDESDPPFDYDGVDLLATAVLNGLSSWFSKLDEEYYALQPWYDGFRKFLRILRGQVPCTNMSL
jgi:hypothetical protein